MEREVNLYLSCAGRRAYLVDWFKSALRGRGRVYVGNSLQAVHAFAAADGALVTPLCTDPAYVPCVLSFCRKHGVSAVLSLYDLDAFVLSGWKEEFSRHGIELLVPERRETLICSDKLRMQEVLKEAGIAVPEMFCTREEAEKKGTFPLIVKPRFGTGSEGVHVCYIPEDLPALMREAAAETHLSCIHMFPEEGHCDILAQEYIIGTEYGMDILCDLKGVFQTVLIRRKLAMRSGETDLAETVDPCSSEGRILYALGEKLAALLPHPLCMDCDVILKKGIPYVIDLNPRIGGGYPVSHLAGADLPQALVRWLLGEEVPEWLFYAAPGVLSGKKPVPERIGRSFSEKPGEVFLAAAQLGEYLIPPLSARKDLDLTEYLEKLERRAETAVCRQDGMICALAAFYANDQESRAGFLTFLCVHQKYRGRGCGRHLAEEVCSRCREAGMKTLRLFVQEENGGARAFYEKLGFSMTGECRQTPHGREDLMEIRL